MHPHVCANLVSNERLYKFMWIHVVKQINHMTNLLENVLLFLCFEFGMIAFMEPWMHLVVVKNIEQECNTNDNANINSELLNG